MTDPAVRKWRLRGAAYLWLYREGARNYPGWQFAADDAACDSLLALTGLFRSAKFPASVSMSLAQPTRSVLAVPNNQGGRARVKAAQELRLRYLQSAPADLWELVPEEARVTLSVGAASLGELERGWHWIRSGGGQCSESVGVEPNLISFWWCVA